MTEEPRFGGFVSGLLGLTIDITQDPHGLGLGELAAVALRRNPRRAHLIVSRVLGKHLPVKGEIASAHGALLGEEVSAVLPAGARVLVIGFCETATGLGHLVAEHLGAPYVHTTRDNRGTAAVWLTFAEPHSHAPAHLILKAATPWIEWAEVVVLVDDELSTGATAMNLVAAIQERTPGKAYVLAALLDVRAGSVREALAVRASELGVSVRCVSLVSGVACVADDAAARVKPLVDSAFIEAVTGGAVEPESIDTLEVLDRASGRSGSPHLAHVDTVRKVSAWVRERVEDPSRLLLVGTEETMFLPIKVAEELGCDVQSTTRSPIVVGRFDECYPVRSGLTFPSCYDPSIPAYLYNGLESAGAERRYADVAVITDQASFESGVLTRAGGLVQAVRTSGARCLLVALRPAECR